MGVIPKQVCMTIVKKFNKKNFRGNVRGEYAHGEYAQKLKAWLN